ncbi:hypothetical protein FNV43_RR22288 [Rhamnella rubrinervis]|uniref:Uncharacterized protein n=1 Tax=Rhamnella rubrinervis TaxID=2594499 RepID=A0A8K0DR96_9ROSA|nr:hypothetical protein FNV43_RR22288 [Rhamnella rubrinervis]
MRSAKFQSFTRGGFSDSRTQLTFLGKVFFCQATDSGVNGSFGSKVVAPTVLEAEKEEAKTVLTLFLKKKGLCNAAASRTIKKSDHFIRHLVSRLHSVHKPRHLVEQELTTCDIRDALIPYLESLEKEYGNALVDVVESFPSPLAKEKAVEFLLDLRASNSDIPSIFSRSPQLCRSSLSENIIPAVALLESLGVEKKKWAKLIKVFPFVLRYSRQKVKTTVNFLYEMGLPTESVGKILAEFPQIIGFSVEDKLRPTACAEAFSHFRVLVLS